MTIIQALASKCAELGARPGESARAFRARDPKAAAQLAAFIDENRAALVRDVTAKLVQP